MIKKLIAATLVLASVFSASSAIADPGCDYGRCFELVVANNAGERLNVIIDPYFCYEGETGEFELGHGESRAINIARVQGHGCNGEQGTFGLRVQSYPHYDRWQGKNIYQWPNWGLERFQFDNATGLAVIPSTMSCQYTSCAGTLGPRMQSSGGWATYTYTLNR